MFLHLLYIMSLANQYETDMNTVVFIMNDQTTEHEIMDIIQNITNITTSSENVGLGIDENVLLRITQRGFLEPLRYLYNNVGTYGTYGIMDAELQIDLLYCAVTNNHLYVAQWLDSQITQPKTSYLPKIFIEALMLKTTSSEMVQWLWAIIPKPIDLFMPTSTGTVCNIFEVTCKLGFLERAQWLMTISEGKFAEYVSSSFTLACIYGHLDVLIWLYTFNPSDRHASWFRDACYHGHIHVIMWLLTKYNYVTLNPNPTDLFALVCKTGRLPIAQFLWSLNERYQELLTTCIVLENEIGGALDEACCSGCVPLVEWVFTLTQPYARYNPCRFLYGPVYTYNSTQNHINCTFVNSCTRAQLDVAKWLWNNKINHVETKQTRLSLLCTAFLIPNNTHIETKSWLLLEITTHYVWHELQHKVALLYETVCRGYSSNYVDMAIWLMDTFPFLPKVEIKDGCFIKHLPKQKVAHTNPSLVISECSICQGSNANVMVNGCMHQFCYTCLDQWYIQQHTNGTATTCPYCRGKLTSCDELN